MIILRGDRNSYIRIAENVTKPQTKEPVMVNRRGIQYDPVTKVLFMHT